MAFWWPAGYAVRFDPVELIDPAGHVVAKEGEEVIVGGGGRPAPPDAPCAWAGQWAFYVQSLPYRAVQSTTVLPPTTALPPVSTAPSSLPGNVPHPCIPPSVGAPPCPYGGDSVGGANK
jgi:hypothetical protein